jgi:hypothetical protein
MTKLLRLITLVALLLSPCLFAANSDVEKLAGTYKGEVYNNSDLDAVTTTFRFERDGRISGNYEVDEEEGSFKGHISNVRFEGPRTISFEWTDKFGEGFATVEFASDYQSFVGEWTSKDSKSPSPWTGKK